MAGSSQGRALGRVAAGRRAAGVPTLGIMLGLQRGGGGPLGALAAAGAGTKVTVQRMLAREGIRFDCNLAPCSTWHVLRNDARRPGGQHWRLSIGQA
jgi:hypothetical protein